MMYDFGIKLKALREDKGMSQKEVAELLGIQRASVSQYESSGGYPTVDRLIKLAQYFQVSTDYLLGLTEDNRFGMDTLTDDQAVAVMNIIRQFELANAQKRG